MAVSFRVLFLLGLFVAAASAKSLSLVANDDSTTLTPIVDDSTTLAPIVDDSTTLAPIVDGSTTLAPIVDGSTTLAPIVDVSTTAGTTRTPYTKPTDVPDTIPTSCDDIDFLFIPAPGDCSSYIVCNIFHPSYLMHCPAGLEFSYSEQICNWPWLAQCESEQAV